MASKNKKNAVECDLLILTELMKHLKIPVVERQHCIKMVKWGGLAIETWLEQAITKVSKIKRSNKDGEDFVNGWEAKKCTVTYHSHGKCNSTVNREANVGNLHMKHGDVLIVAADPLSQELFYFKVPSVEIQGRKAITITFNINGGEMTKFSPRNGSVENSFSWRLWNLYRKKSFRELCKIVD